MPQIVQPVDLADQDESDEPPVKERLTLFGLPIAIEYHRGDTKPDNPPFTLPPKDNYPQAGWPMYADYGYVEETIANDGEELDVFIGQDRESSFVALAYLLEQNDEAYPYTYGPCIDEPKLLMCFTDVDQAVQFIQTQYGRDHVFSVVVTDYGSLAQDIALTRQKYLRETNATESDELPEPVTYEQHEEPGLVIGI